MHVLSVYVWVRTYFVNVCVFVCVCARACVRACVCVCVLIHSSAVYVSAHFVSACQLVCSTQNRITLYPLRLRGIRKTKHLN